MRTRRDRRPLLPVGGLALVMLVPALPAAAAEPETADPPRERVEVASLTTETTQVYAEPDGTYTATLHHEPVRVRRDGGWVDVDTTLAAAPDGTVAPKAVPVPLILSGGGAGPLVRLGLPGGSGAETAVSWPGVLPPPRLAGDTAVYPDVLPGVDLHVTAEVLGYATTLVLEDRSAAAHAAEVSFDVSSTGEPRRGAAGIATVQPDGDVLRVSWSDALANAEVGFAAGRLTVAPDQALLDGPDTAYPVSLHPLAGEGIPRTLSRSGWAKVKSGSLAGNPYWNGGIADNWAKVGRCPASLDPTCGPVQVVRTFFQYNVGFLRGKDVLSARFNARMGHAATCGPPASERVELHRAAPMSAGDPPKWNRQPAAEGARLGSTTAAYGRSGCAEDSVGFDVASAVRHSLANSRSVVNLRLKTEAESSQLGWRKFRTRPDFTFLTVTYNTPPQVPDRLSADGMGCTAADRPQYTNLKAPATLRARVRDPDGNAGGKVRARFAWYDAGGSGAVGAKRGERLTERLSAGSTSFIATVGTGTFGDGSRFAYRVQGVDDNGGSGPWSPYCHVVVDRTPPDRPPGVASEHYPAGDERHGSPGQSGLFTFTANGVADVAGFWYGLSDTGTAEPSRFVAASPQWDGTQRATVMLTPLASLDHTLSVISVDRAGNSTLGDGGGGAHHFRFAVGESTGSVGHWPLAGRGDDPAAPDASGHGHPATVHGLGTGARWVPGRSGDALRFDGTGGHAATRAAGGGLERIARTDQSFTVSAWVRVDADTSGGWRTAVSQESDRSGGFFLQYNGGTGEVSFAMPQSAESTVLDRATATLPATGVWTHLAGVYVRDNPDGAAMRLYVDGRLAATRSRPPERAWHQDGPLQIGRGKWTGAWGQSWVGDIDEVQVYNRALLPDHLRGKADLPAPWDRGLANGPIRREVSYPLGDGAGDLAQDRSGNHRPAVLTVGAGWREGAGVDGGTVLDLDGDGAHARSLDPVVRTDGSFTVTAWVRPETLDRTHRAVVSQDGAHQSGFMLRYDHGACPAPPCGPGEGAWAFTVPRADQPTLSGITVTDTQPAGNHLGGWVHLAGVLDVSLGELRLHVNGGPPRELDLDAFNATRWHAAGGLQIGRAKRNGAEVDFFHGQIAGVEVHTGVLTWDEIRAARNCRCPDVTEPTVHTGPFTRWASHAGDRVTTTAGRAPHGYHFQEVLGLPAPEGAPEPTRMLYGCAAGQLGGDGFTSADPGCEGQRRLGELGLAYLEPPDGTPSVPLYRCRIEGTVGYHFDSVEEDCEGHRQEGMLGYLVAYVPLVRYVHPSAHWTSTAAVPARYQPEGVLGLVSMVGGPGLAPLYACPTATTGAFTSRDPGCEQTGITGELIGHIWSEPPAGPGIGSMPLFRCRSDADHFDSLDPGCEGRHRDGELGHVMFRW